MTIDQILKTMGTVLAVEHTAEFNIISQNQESPGFMKGYNNKVAQVWKSADMKWFPWMD